MPFGCQGGQESRQHTNLDDLLISHFHVGFQLEKTTCELWKETVSRLEFLIALSSPMLCHVVAAFLLRVIFSLVFIRLFFRVRGSKSIPVVNITVSLCFLLLSLCLLHSCCFRSRVSCGPFCRCTLLAVTRHCCPSVSSNGFTARSRTGARSRNGSPRFRAVLSANRFSLRTLGRFFERFLKRR